jgi:hypothetical protein
MLNDGYGHGVGVWDEGVLVLVIGLFLFLFLSRVRVFFLTTTVVMPLCFRVCIFTIALVIYPPFILRLLYAKRVLYAPVI